MDIGEAEIRAQLDRLLDSRALGPSESLRRLLCYFAEKTLAGEADQLKEYTIGIDVLAKPPMYDPRGDSTVRHQVARLRQKIAEYYQEEGRRDGVFVSLPKGLCQDFHFGARHGTRIHPLALLRSSVVGSCPSGAVFVSARRSFGLPENSKSGKLRLFSACHKHLSHPHLRGRLISPLRSPLLTRSPLPARQCAVACSRTAAV